MWQRGALLSGRISTDVEPLLRRQQADAFMVTGADKGVERGKTPSLDYFEIWTIAGIINELS